MTSIIQPAAPAATPATILPKTLINTKQKPAIAPIPAKKIQRLNGAKFVVTNNCEKVMITLTSLQLNETLHNILLFRTSYMF